jgi:hypothetical protein
MSSLTEHLAELSNQIGFTEQVRLTPAIRTAGINEALKVVFNLLSGSNILKRTTTITSDTTSTSVVSPIDGAADAPSDFNEGTVIFMGDNSTYDDSDEIFEVDEQDFGRWSDGNDDVFTQRYHSTSGTLEFLFKGAGAGTFYIEYEMGAPTLVNGSDKDNLPNKALPIVAKVAAGILTDNVLSDSTRMQTFLYGPQGNPSRYTPNSVMGQLQGMILKRRIRPQSGRISQISLIKR